MPNKPGDTEKKFLELKKILQNTGGLVIAYSGGVDSTFLLRVAQDILGSRVVAVTANSATYPPEEVEAAKQYAKKLGARHFIISTSELASPHFCKNPPERCYYCKKDLYTKLKEVARSEKINNIADGSNLDDENDFRPGHKAGREMGIISPLKDAHLTKNEIRFLSRKMNLATWNKPSFACLASRFPYGERITLPKLQMVREAERYLVNLFQTKRLRVRHHFPIARIEVPQEIMTQFTDQGLRERIIGKFKEIGYIYATLDLAGFRSGSMNEIWDGKKYPLPDEKGAADD